MTDYVEAKLHRSSELNQAIINYFCQFIFIYRISVHAK